MKQRVAQSMKQGIREGGVSALASSITETYIPQFALALKATATHISWLTAIPSLIAPLAQLLGTKLMNRYSRKKIVVLTVALQALCFIPIALIGWCISQDIIQTHALTLLLIAYALLMSVGAIPSPVWFSWMGDLIPAKQRGAYFSTRYKVIGIASMAIILAGLALDYYQTKGLALSMFGIVFTIAACARLCSAYMVTKQYEPPYNNKTTAIPYSLWHFLTHKTATRTFVIYVGLFNFVMYIAAPFFPLYMRQDLSLSYTWITLISLASFLFYIIALPYVGRFSDTYGNLRLFYLASILYALNPLVWLLFPHPVLLLAIQVIGGVANAAYAVAIVNYLLNTVSHKEHAIVATYLNIIVGISIFLGSLLGGYAMTYHPTWISAIAYTFIISTIGRCIIMFMGIKHMRERENVSPLPRDARPSFSHPLRSLYGEFHFLKQLKR